MRQPGLQLSPNEVDLKGAERVICLKTALAAFDAIVTQGEGAKNAAANSHFARFAAIRDEYRALLAANPEFRPAFPSAHNPVLRTPPRPENRVWLEDARASACVDLANARYALMLRMLAHSYSIVGPNPEKTLLVDIAIALMHSVTLFGERAARLPAVRRIPTAMRACRSLRCATRRRCRRAASTRRFFIERLGELAGCARGLCGDADPRTLDAASRIEALAARAARDFTRVAAAASSAQPSRPVVPPASPPPAASTATADGGQPRTEAGVEYIEGKDLTLLYEGRKCIHSRFCVTGAPKVFLANVVGPWIHPDEMNVDGLVEIAALCPSGAIRYQRKDGKPDESAPPVNLLSLREGGPYAVRADILLDGERIGYRATLCRCGASKNKPFCDGSHHTINFDATGEPPSTDKTAMLEVRGRRDRGGSRARRTVQGARQSRDHQRHGTRRRAACKPPGSAVADRATRSRFATTVISASASRADPRSNQREGSSLSMTVSASIGDAVKP